MFYVLDFTDHSFKSFHTTEEVTNFIKEYKDAKKDESNIEIINAYPLDIRLSVEEFIKEWGD